MEIKIPKIIKDLNSTFKENGYSLYLVGGTVRDSYIGIEPKDFDVVSNATVEEMLDFLSDKYKCKSQGESFGVIVVYTDDNPEGIDIASFQTRNNGVVKTGMTIHEDISRRDLTFNALFYDLDKMEVVDLVGGLDDLDNRLSRMVGNPSERIKEDPLRIMRVIRFTSIYDGSIHTDTYNAISENKHLINEVSIERPKGISQERLVAEFIKTFEKSPNPMIMMKWLSDFNLWDNLFNGITVNDLIHNTDDLSLFMTQLLVNDSSFLANKDIGVSEWGFDSSLIKRVHFLIRLINLNSENVIDLERDRYRFHITDELLLKFNDIYKVNHINDFISFNSSDINSSAREEFGTITKSNGKEFGVFLKSKKRELWETTIG